MIKLRFRTYCSEILRRIQCYLRVYEFLSRIFFLDLIRFPSTLLSILESFGRVSFLTMLQLSLSNLVVSEQELIVINSDAAETKGRCQLDLDSCLEKLRHVKSLDALPNICSPDRRRYDWRWG